MKFEKVSKYATDEEVKTPTRATAGSAAYDFYVAEDMFVPPLEQHTMTMLKDGLGVPADNIIDLDKMAEITKRTFAKPTLVSTGVKCKLDKDCYLKLIVRSSTPLKYWLLCANGEGIIDSDYYNNADNEGEIFVQLINLSPFTIHLKKGDRVAQGIIERYEVTEDDAANGIRMGGFGSTNAEIPIST